MASTELQVTDSGRGPIAAPEEEREALMRIARLLKHGQVRAAKLITSTGEEVALPATLLRIVQRSASYLSRENAVLMEPVGKQLTTQEAADLLHVSRPHLVKLLEEGALPYVMVGAHRRVQLDDLLAYSRRRAIRRAKVLGEMARMGQEWGLYDLDYNEIERQRLDEMNDDSES